MSEDLHAIRVIGPATNRRLVIDDNEINGVKSVSIDFDAHALSEVTIRLISDDVRVEPRGEA